MCPENVFVCVCVDNFVQGCRLLYRGYYPRSERVETCPFSIHRPILLRLKSLKNPAKVTTNCVLNMFTGRHLLGWAVCVCLWSSSSL